MGPLLPGQIAVGDLLMGDGTDFAVLPDFDPWSRTILADQSGDRAWGHGGWSGSEWTGKAVVGMKVDLKEESWGSWELLRQQLSAAFRAVGDTGTERELRWHDGAREYVMFGRPRLLAFREMLLASPSFSRADCGFVALDPLIYDGVESTGSIGLPTFEGGLTVPFTVPFSIDAVPVDGQVDLRNEGTADTGLTLRVDGPVPQPRVTVVGPDGTSTTLRYLGDVPAGRFLLITTADRNQGALLDGLPQANHYGRMAGDWPLLPGNPAGGGATSTLLFRSADNNATGRLSWAYRSAWW